MSPSYEAAMTVLATATRIQQLERIDKLRELGLGDDIKLPQLVVVGDQSSGKSSLLEGISGLPFPVASELCTRFATQIVFRRTPQENLPITVSIIPAARASDQHRKRLAEFKQEVAALTGDVFSNILNQAATTMGLPGIHGKFDNCPVRFSDDVLRIEVSGPNNHQFSVVDIPGIFHNPTKHQTIEDAAIIRVMVNEYVKDNRTIIMAVMDARNNLANQEVFRIAKAADREGFRTVGILTKCDAVQKGDEKTAIEIATNKASPLHHGWYCVRNRSTEEIQNGVTIAERHQNEKNFFSESPPFNTIDKKRVGIASLQLALENLLSDHVARLFPEIRKEVDVKLRAYRVELANLGPPRQTAPEQMQYLIKLSTLFQKKVEDALNGQYRDGDVATSRLRMIVQNASGHFAREIGTRGETYKFRNISDMQEIETEGDDRKGLNAFGFGANVSSDGFFPKTGPFGGKGVLFNSLNTVQVQPAQDIYKIIQNVYLSSRGKELPGLVNPRVLEELFAMQTTKWRPIAEEHVHGIIVSVRECLSIFFESTIKDRDLRARVRVRIDALVDESIKLALSELDRILVDEREGPLLTDNHYFADTLQACRAERVLASLRKMGFVDGERYVMNFKSMTTMAHLSNEASAVYDIHDALRAYYKVAMKRFVDNVKVQVIERRLFKEHGPVHTFSPDWASALSVPDLQTIAGESFSTSNMRSQLEDQISRLEKANKICAGNAID